MKNKKMGMDKVFLATRILPFLIPLSVEPTLNIAQVFNDIHSTLKYIKMGIIYCFFSTTVQAVHVGGERDVAVCGDGTTESSGAAVQDGRTDQVHHIFPPFLTSS